MKIVALGDTHGRTNWKYIVAKESFDKLVFTGDYFDTHEGISPSQQKRNFEAIIQYKEANIHKVVLLMGNHDLHYLAVMGERYTGFNRHHARDIEQLLTAALEKDYLQMCFHYQHFLFVHAGITKTWCRNTIGKDCFENGETLAHTINNLFDTQPQAFCFTPGRWRDPYGDEVAQSPVWVRPGSLLTDCLDHFTQIVGHTTRKRLIPGARITLIDTLGTSGEYLSMVDGDMQAKKVDNRT